MALSDDLRKKVQKQAMDLSMKLMADERTRPYVAKAMQGYMEGRQKAESARDDILSTLGVASADEVKSLKREASKLNKKLDRLESHIEKIVASNA